MSTHDELVERMARLRAFIAAGNAFLKSGPEKNERTKRIAQAIQAAEVEHDVLRREAINIRPSNWLPG